MARERTRHPLNSEAAGITGGASQKGVTQKGAKKGSKVHGRGKTTGGPRECLEIHLCAGHTPVDVVLVEAWEPAARKRLARMSQPGQCIRVAGVLIKAHTDKAYPWTTPRLQFFAEFGTASMVATMERNPTWLSYHPVTPAASLQHVPDGRLVCFAGRVLPDGPNKKMETVNGEQVAITNFTLRHEGGVIDVSAWRELADLPLALVVGRIYYFAAIKKGLQAGR